MIAGQFPDPWTPPDLSVMPLMSAQESLDQMAKTDAETEQPKSPPLTLPQWFGTGLFNFTHYHGRSELSRWDRTSCNGITQDTSGRRLRSLKYGTGAWSQEAGVLNIGGVSFNVKEKFNTEVMLLASSSDTTLKMAILTIPQIKQRRWRI